MDQTATWIAEWAKLWEVELDDVVVRTNPRLTRTLAQTRPARGEIEIAERVAREASELVREVLCHEAAHIAALRLHGDVTPHGEQWQALVREAGYEPSVRLVLPNEPAPTQRADDGVRYEHRCLRCHSVRTAKRPVTAWRCAACVDAGLDGVLEITSRPARTESRT